MNQFSKNAIFPTRKENYSEWYQNVVKASDLADSSPVRGCMVIKPWGYALWENIRNTLDHMFEKTGVKNAYFPTLIPLSFMEKEAKHVKGFAKECAIVTHHRLSQDNSGKLTPNGPLSEPLVVRPTSETIIGESFSKWIKSHRDLPVLINQWANIIRWEMRTRMFLRTSEFLWQEGHTVHSTAEEAKNRTSKMLKIYKQLAEQYLAIPVIRGKKSKSERFPGAVETLCIEAMMQDKKALQAGTSHFLGQNFAKASNIKFQTKDETEELAWTTSWGVSTRLIGGIIMTHGDDNGIVLPPRISPSHIVILPIFKAPEEKQQVMTYVKNMFEKLDTLYYHEKKLITEIDSRNIGGKRNWEWTKKGIPLIMEIGPQEIKRNSLSIKRRDHENNNKLFLSPDKFIAKVTSILDDIQNNLFEKAAIFRKANTFKTKSLKDFRNFFTPANKIKPEIHGGFALTHWCGKESCEIEIKKELSVSMRCILINQKKTTGKCINCNEKSTNQVVFAKAY